MEKFIKLLQNNVKENKLVLEISGLCRKAGSQMPKFDLYLGQE